MTGVDSAYFEEVELNVLIEKDEENETISVSDTDAVTDADTIEPLSLDTDARTDDVEAEDATLEGAWLVDTEVEASPSDAETETEAGIADED